MRRPFSLLREAAHDAADSIGITFETTCTVSREEWIFDGYVFTLHADGIDFRLEICGEDLDEHFKDLP